MKKVVLSLIVLVLLASQVLIAAPINVNQATAQELAENLKGVGIKKAQAIIQYREKIGGFQSETQLLGVKGIGEAILDQNKGNILIE